MTEIKAREKKRQEHLNRLKSAAELSNIHAHLDGRIREV